MNESDRTFAFALARVQFPPRCSCLKFVDSMVWLAQHGTRKPITTAQRTYLYSCVIRFQRQINANLVEGARKELAALKGAEQGRDGR